VADGGGTLELRLRDTGPGVPPEERERIFEPFVTTKEGGTGLGLAIARQILQEHGGDLTCEAPTGPGALFVLRLPIAPETSSPRRHGGAENEIGTGSEPEQCETRHRE
jgi:signal transduction histidine kinase